MDTGESKAQQIRLKQQHLRTPGLSSYTPNFQHKVFNFHLVRPPLPSPLSDHSPGAASAPAPLRCCLPLPLAKRQSQDP